MPKAECYGYTCQRFITGETNRRHMKALRYYAYGPPSVLTLQDVGLPTVGDDDVLVRVRAAGVNAGDLHYLRGTPYVFRAMAGLSRPKDNGLGADFAGEVEAVGKNVTA